MADLRRRLGDQGEQVAACWYEQHGYDVVERNWRCRAGELDLVVRRGGEFVFVEVKARTSTAFMSPLEAVTHEKRRRIRHLAALWIDQSPVRPVQIRFDVVAVVGDDIEVVQGAF